MYNDSHLVLYWMVSCLIFCKMVTGSWWKINGSDVGRSAEKNKCTKSVISSFIGL